MLLVRFHRDTQSNNDVSWSCLPLCSFQKQTTTVPGLPVSSLDLWLEDDRDIRLDISSGLQNGSRRSSNRLGLTPVSFELRVNDQYSSNPTTSRLKNTDPYKGFVAIQNHAMPAGAIKQSGSRRVIRITIKQQLYTPDDARFLLQPTNCDK